MKFLMTGYIPQPLRVPSYIDDKVEVKDGILIRLDLEAKYLTSVPDSIGNLVNLTELYFDIMQEFS